MIFVEGKGVDVATRDGSRCAAKVEDPENLHTKLE